MEGILTIRELRKIIQNIDDKYLDRNIALSYSAADKNGQMKTMVVEAHKVEWFDTWCGIRVLNIISE